jgi:energy-coupling factor transport system substrate-specific component
MGMDEESVKNINFIALLHDIGKIGVPDAVLNKPAALTDEEYAIIKQHPTTGYDILKDIRIIPDVHLGALYHHERYDGTGYPHGLKGEDIPLIARIIAIADTYDAMTSNRAYRKALTNDIVISEMEKNKGKQFDPALAELFIKMLKDGFSLD